MSETRAESPKPQQAVASEVNLTPTKSTPSKRKSKLEREREESEEIIKSMGGAVVEEGGRRTRSSARGGSTQATPPPPAKKSKLDTPSRRGRQKKDILDVVEEPDTTDASTPSTQASESASQDVAPAAVDEKTDEPESMEVDGAICSKSTEKDDENEPEPAEAAVVENGDTTKVDEAKPEEAPAPQPAEPVAELESSTEKAVGINTENTANDAAKIDSVIESVEESDEVPETEAAAPTEKEVSVDEAIVVPEVIAAPVVAEEPEAIVIDSSNTSSSDDSPKTEIKLSETVSSDVPTIEASVPANEAEVL